MSTKQKQKKKWINDHAEYIISYKQMLVKKICDIIL